MIGLSDLVHAGVTSWADVPGGHPLPAITGQRLPAPQASPLGLSDSLIFGMPGTRT